MYTHIMERNLPNTIVDAHADSKLLRKIKKKQKKEGFTLLWTSIKAQQCRPIYTQNILLNTKS